MTPAELPPRPGADYVEVGIALALQKQVSSTKVEMAFAAEILHLRAERDAARKDGSLTLLENEIRGAFLEGTRSANCCEVELTAKVEMRIQKALSRLAAAADWPTIETAPRDGTKVLLTDDDDQVETGYWGRDEGYWTNGWLDSCEEPVMLRPTHWHPIPPFRKQEGER